MLSTLLPHPLRFVTIVAGIAALVAACGSDTDARSSAALDSYSFVMSLSVVPDVDQPPQLVAELNGRATTSPYAVRISGDLFGDRIAMVSDGEQWWDPDHPELGPTEGGLVLLYNGFLQPSDIAVLLDDEAAWEQVGVEEHLGVPVRHSLRKGIVKDRDWELGDLYSLDVWSSESGQIVKFAALFGTGDNRGFPLAAWEITGREPALDIAVPTSP